MVFVLVLKKNAIIQTILRITENGVSIGTKIKKMVLTHLGSGAISRIPDLNANNRGKSCRENIKDSLGKPQDFLLIPAK